MKTSRRRFLTAIGATASATLLAPSIFDFKLLAGSPFVRPNVSGLASDSPILNGYRTAIAAMQALPDNNPLSWTYQTAIHYTTATVLSPGWDSCKYAHGTNFFWAWHRMYLFWWERIVRKYSGDPGWVLPYWDWTDNPTLPAPFRDSTPGNVLYTANRDVNINEGAALPASDVSYAASFAELDYYTAQNEFDSSPHTTVHVDVGGKTGWMAHIPTASLDPIFYLHHANVDRLWDLYLAQGGGRSDPTSDSTWTTRVFYFADENGNVVSMTPCDVLNAAAQLNYEYEGEPTQVVQSCGTPAVWTFTTEEMLAVPFPGGPIGADPYINEVSIANVKAQLAQIVGNDLQEVRLELDGVQAEEQPGCTWEVYVGLPAGAAPETTSPFFVGKMALFSGIKSVRNFKPATLHFNATRALKAVIEAGGETANISFFAKGIVVNGKQLPGEPLFPVTVASGAFKVSTRKRQ